MTMHDLEQANIERIERGDKPLTWEQAQRAINNWSRRDLSLHLFLVRTHNVNTYRPSGRTLKRSEVER
jgi:hypothetical protein